MLAVDQPNISVIIPVYNGVHTLKRCLKAVLASDGASYECIVVDDCSTDRSYEMVTDFHSEVRLLNLPKGPRGPAHARNRGAELANGKILFFVDADVVLACGALRRIAAIFSERPSLAAVFGSYDANPSAPGLVSQYRNLLHHFVHQNGNPNASTFWAGCGAIRKDVFERVGGFDEKRFHRSSIEDIELGYRLKDLGLSILLDRDLQGSHLKSWNLRSMIKTDILHRALPWSRLIVESKNLPNDLNLRWRERASFGLLALSLVWLPLAFLSPEWLIGSTVALLAIGFLNRRLYAFFFRQRGALFAARCVPLHLLYYLYSGLTYLWAWTDFHLKRIGRSISELRSSLQPRTRQKTD
jgi:glycosyltransferase involved in cell wall biosynthesis